MRIIPSDGWEKRYAKALAGAGWTCHEPGSSCIGEGHVFSGKRSTSKRAALHVLGKTGNQRRKVLQYLIDYGPATDEEMQEGLRIEGNSQRPRRGELVSGGFVKHSGKVKVLHGEECIIWEVAPGVPSEVETG